jgi:hypothetical protein
MKNRKTKEKDRELKLTALFLLKEPLARSLFCLKAVETENWATTLRFWAWLKWNLAVCTTLGTRCREHLPCLHALIFSLVAAVFATLWSGKAALSVESLLTLGESE